MKRILLTLLLFLITYFGFSQATATTIVNNISCSGLNDGSIIIIANGGTAPYSYSIDGGVSFVTNNIFTNLSAGMYSYLVKDSANVISNVSNVVIQSPTPVTCSLNIVGNTVAIIASGGNAPYSFSVNGTAFQSSPVFNNLTAGTYTFLVRDMNNCVSTCIATINPSAFEVLIGETLDNPTSTVFAIITNSSGPYTYQWYIDNFPIAGATNEAVNVNHAVSGCYTVQVTNSLGQIGYPVNARCYGQNNAIAINDTFIENLNPNGNTVSNYNLLTNDTMSGVPVLGLNQAPVQIVTQNLPVGFSVNNNGFITINNNVLSGSYTFNYRFSSSFTLLTSNWATVSITVNQQNTGVVLKAFLDSNNNSIQDSNEVLFQNGTFGYVVNNNGITNFITSPNGMYFIVDNNTNNTYNFSYTINNGQNLCYSVSPTAFTNVVVTAGIQTLYFPVVQTPCTDLSVSLLNQSTPPRPGFIYNNQIIYKNNGNQTITSGTITFTKDALLGNITSTFPNGATITGNNLTFPFTNLAPNETRELRVNIQVPTIPTINLGQLVTNSASITIPTNDFNTLNNTSSLTQTVVGSYDPNDKMESHGSKIVHSTFTANDYLRYTIRFENTGTFSAENVRVNDLLDSKLDETSIKMINSSHDYSLSRTGNELNWNFNDINLPPSVPNTTIGHGHITFEIKPKPGYVVGDIIPNMASIFFDFNPPIITNTFNTEFVNALNIPTFNKNNFIVYPNPSSGILNISSNGNVDFIESISIHNLLGKTLYSKNVNDTSTQIDLSNFSKGMYFVIIKSGNLSKTIKIIHQ